MRPKWNTILPVFLPCAALLTLTIGCASTSAVKGTTFADVRQEKGSGSIRTYEAPFDAVWDNIPRVVHELGLSVAGDNKQDCYFLAERGTSGEKVVVFAERGDEKHTRIEVISRQVWSVAPDDNYPNWEPQILGNLDRKMKDPSWESRWLQGNFYLSLNASSGKRDIPVRKQTTAREEFSDGSFDGFNLSLMSGYDINRYLGVEIGLGYSTFSYSSCRDTFICVSADSGEFTYHPVTASFIYHFFRGSGYPPVEFHLGLGIEYHRSPTLEYTQPGGSGFFASTTRTVHYNNAHGYNAGIGGSRSGRYAFFSFDVKYVFDLKYKAREMDVDGVTSDTVLPAWRELDGSGVMYGIGLGHHF